MRCVVSSTLFCLFGEWICLRTMLGLCKERLDSDGQALSTFADWSGNEILHHNADIHVQCLLASSFRRINLRNCVSATHGLASTPRRCRVFAGCSTTNGLASLSVQGAHQGLGLNLILCCKTSTEALTALAAPISCQVEPKASSKRMWLSHRILAV